MDRTALVEQLVMSEKNNSIVEIKITNTDRLVVGAVQKVLNQIIILKSAASEPITLTFADIESVKRLTNNFFSGACLRIVKSLQKRLRTR